MSLPSTITAAVFDKILGFLAPLFVIAGTTDTAAARDVARATLAGYGARTDRELRFAALSVAFSFGALEAVGKAADPGLSINQMLRLNGNANALNRAAHQNENRLEKLLRQPPAMTKREDSIVATPHAADTLPASADIDELVLFARSMLEATMTNPVVPAPTSVAPLSRQQRRAAERKAEKVRLRQVEDARLAQRAMQRAAMARQPAMQRALMD